MRKYRFLVAILIGLFVLNTSCKRTCPLPVSEIIVQRNAYTLAYDGQHRQAKYVYEYLTPDRVRGSVDRQKFCFQEDPLIPEAIRATLQDYYRSGFDRGHLCPAGDCRSSEKEMDDSFYLSNISPQNHSFNCGYWASLERHVRDLTKTHGALHVFTGGLYLPNEEDDGKRYVRYQVIGPNGVSVPTHYFKLVLNKSNQPIEAFILPNEPISSEVPLERFKTTIERIEKVAGVVFRRSN